MNKALVSVIIPAYKAEKYILQALESVRKQSYSNWEIVIVEDGSKDRTEEIVSKFANAVPGHKITFIHHKTNLGTSAAKNTAIQKARGEYLAFLDYDDILKETHLSESVKALEEHNADLVYSSVTVFDSGKNTENRTYGATSEELKTFPKSLYYRNYIANCTLVVRKNAIEKIGLFDANLHFCEDYDCWIRMARAGFKFVYIKGSHSLRRLHQSNLSKNIRGMTEGELYVMKKHQDWNSISTNVKARRVADIYDRLAGFWEDVDTWKSARFFLCAWLLQPLNPYRVRRLARIFKYVIRMHLKMFK